MLMVVAEAGGMPGLIVNTGAEVTETDWANARLIAAAPELLEALLLVRKWNMDRASHSSTYVMDVIEAAIANATGEVE